MCGAPFAVVQIHVSVARSEVICAGNQVSFVQFQLGNGFLGTLVKGQIVVVHLVEVFKGKHSFMNNVIEADVFCNLVLRAVQVLILCFLLNAGGQLDNSIFKREYWE